MKPGAPVSAAALIEISDPAQAYVSRAALKLKAGLDAFGFDPEGRVALDIGASTGGFTQVSAGGRCGPCDRGRCRP
jgi:23S rRNA (cytidine1920-2'-O)/16S rRNA (cytidine1409-2'-O)-methyltransferase